MYIIRISILLFYFLCLKGDQPYIENASALYYKQYHMIDV